MLRAERRQRLQTPAPALQLTMKVMPCLGVSAAVNIRASAGQKHQVHSAPRGWGWTTTTREDATVAAPASAPSLHQDVPVGGWVLTVPSGPSGEDQRSIFPHGPLPACLGGFLPVSWSPKSSMDSASRCFKGGKEFSDPLDIPAARAVG
ncbi:hypothetical protein AAY473_015935 [Plecturocebus cupreus]